MDLLEKMYNPIFNVTEFRYIKNESGSNGFEKSMGTPLIFDPIFSNQNLANLNRKLILINIHHDKI